jgi:hypothetical protein
MPAPRIVLIAAPELIPALRERLGGNDEELLTFADSEPLLALQAIAADRPPIVALERLFAASPRGAALITRIKADRALDACEIRILSHDSDYTRVSPRTPANSTPPPRPARVYRRASRLDTGTRRVDRFRMRADVSMMLENRPAFVVDLSELGTQVLAHASLKPKQHVHALLDPGGLELELEGTVVWVQVERVGGRTAYRAGIEFEAPDRPAIARFCEKNKV